MLVVLLPLLRVHAGRLPHTLTPLARTRVTLGHETLVQLLKPTTGAYQPNADYQFTF
jgi:hypothetical protein